MSCGRLGKDNKHMNKTVYEIAYMGYSSDMLRYLLKSENFNLCKVVGVHGKGNDVFQQLVKDHKIPYMEIENKGMLEEAYAFIGNMDAIILFEFDYILSQEFVDSMRVFNLHGGNLRTNRGAHPVVWSILLQEKETCLSAYQLTGGIDVGILIGEYSVNIMEEETTSSLAMKLRTGIPALLEQIVVYLSGNIRGCLVENGIYRRRVKERDYTIDEGDSEATIKAKINSQDCYGGAVINCGGKKYRVSSLDEIKEIKCNGSVIKRSERK